MDESQAAVTEVYTDTDKGIIQIMDESQAAVTEVYSDTDKGIIQMLDESQAAVTEVYTDTDKGIIQIMDESQAAVTEVYTDTDKGIIQIIDESQAAVTEVYTDTDKGIIQIMDESQAAVTEVYTDTDKGIIQMLGESQAAVTEVYTDTDKGIIQIMDESQAAVTEVYTDTDKGIIQIIDESQAAVTEVYTDTDKCIIQIIDESQAAVTEVYTDTDKRIIQMFELAASSQNCSTLLYISDQLDNLTSESIHSCLKASVMPELFIQIINIAVIGDLPHQEQPEYDDKDFDGAAAKMEAVLKCFVSLFNHLDSQEYLDRAGCHCLNSILPSLFLLTSANLSPTAWNTSTIVENSIQLTGHILKLYNCKSMGEILTLNMNNQDCDLISPSSLFAKYLCLVKPYLDKERWKKNPFVKASFTCMLTYTKPSSVSEHLADILPPSLKFVDDFVIENKMSGMQCLIHIVSRTSAEELRWYGRAEVVYEAVKHQLYTKNDALLQNVLPTLLTLIKIIEQTPDRNHSNKVLDVNRFDVVLEMLVRDAETENNIHIRRTLTSNLSEYVDIIGVGAVRHLRTVVHLVSNFLEIYDGPEETSRLNVLTLLASVIKNGWPRVYKYCKDILKSLLKLVYDLAMDEMLTPKVVKENLYDKCVHCLVLLRYCCTDIVESYLNELNKAEIAECITETVFQVMHADVPCF